MNKLFIAVINVAFLKIEYLFMSCYEFVMMIRHDLSSSEVDKVVSSMSDLIKSHNSEVVKSEYWGLKRLEYKIQNSGKAHYYFMGITAEDALLKDIKRKIKFSENIIRHLIIKVPSISKDASELAKSNESVVEEVMDVTSSPSS